MVGLLLYHVLIFSLKADRSRVAAWISCAESWGADDDRQAHHSPDVLSGVRAARAVDRDVRVVAPRAVRSRPDDRRTARIEKPGRKDPRAVWAQRSGGRPVCRLCEG